MNRTVGVDLHANVSSYIAGVQNARRATRDLANEAMRASKTNKASIDQVGRGFLLFGGAALAGFGLATKATMGFDKAMSGVAAVSNASRAEMGALSDAALKAGKDTVFSASQAADAEAELAKAGVSTADILGGALRGSLDLAAAGQLDLADAATISAQAMNIFELRGQDVGHIADVLAAGANKSAADVKQLGDALRQGGLVAAQTGLSLEETTGVLAAFADRALVGSDAGTSLKTMLQRLTPDSDKAAAAMERIGFSAFDSQGEFVGLASVAQQLQTGLGQLSAQERASTLDIIFGSDAVRAASVLYEQGAAGVNEYTRAVNDNGAAQRMAARQLDNLAGDLEQLQGSIETALIKSGSKATGVLRGLTQAATSTVNAYSEAPGAVQGAATSFLAIGGAASVAVGGLLVLLPRIAETRQALRDLDKAGLSASARLKGIGTAATVAAVAVPLVAGAFEALHNQISNQLGTDTRDVEAFSNSIVDFAQRGRAMGDLADEFGPGLEGIDEALGELTGKSNAIAGFANKLDNVVLPLKALPGVNEDAANSFKSLDQSLASLTAGGNADIAAVMFDEIKARAKAQGVEIDTLRKLFPEYTAALDNAAVASKTGADATGDLAGSFDDVSPAVQDAADALEAYQGQLDALAGNVDAFRSQLQLKEAFQDVTKAVDKNVHAISDDEKSALADLADQAIDTAQAMLDQGKSQREVNGVLRDARDRLRAAAEAMGYSAGQAKRLADRLLGIPRRTDVKVQTPGLDATIQRIADLRWELAHVPTAVTIGVFNKVKAAGPNLAEGGPVFGPGTGTSDSVPAMLSNGEHVWTAREVAAVGGHSAVELLRARALQGNVARFATGGAVVASRVPATQVTQGGVSIGKVEVHGRDAMEATIALPQRLRIDAWKAGAVAV